MPNENDNKQIRYRIKDLPQHERPRERLRDFGPGALSNAELLAILLRTGTASATAIELAAGLLSRYGSLGKIAGLSVAELSRAHGMGMAKSAQVLAALEMGRRAASYQDGERPQITCPADVARLLQPEMRQYKKEITKAVLVNTKNEVMGMRQISEGTLDTSLLHPREVFREAIREAAAAVILVHNHPSGDPAPSKDDIAVTKEFVKAGRLLDIELLDHIIIGGAGYTSLRELGYME